MHLQAPVIVVIYHKSGRGFLTGSNYYLLQGDTSCCS